MSELKITVSCCLCDRQHEESITLPDGWSTRYGGTDVEDGFCPDHAVIADFADDQCPGCVGGWGDCPLFDGFAYGHHGNNGAKYGEAPLSEIEHQQLCQGYCPRRVNGTLAFSPSTGIQEINLSQEAKQGGTELSLAIKAYVKRYANAA